MLAALPEGTDVIVTSPVGMDVNTSRADLLPEMLDAVLSGGMLPDADTGSGFVWKLRAALPTGLRARVASALPDKVALALTERLELRGQDWTATRAFAQPADNQGYVRLNLRGRERDGIVEPAEAEALMDEIASGLMTFADPDGTRREGGRAGSGHVRHRRALRPAARPDRPVERPGGHPADRRRVATVRHRAPARARQRPLRQPHGG